MEMYAPIYMVDLPMVVTPGSHDYKGVLFKDDRGEFPKYHRDLRWFVLPDLTDAGGEPLPVLSWLTSEEIGKKKMTEVVAGTTLLGVMELGSRPEEGH